MRALSALYPGQVDTSDPTGWPYGRPRNATALNDGTGTPLEREVMTDIVGPLQAILVAAGIEPDGQPERADASQVLSALLSLFYSRELVDGFVADLDARKVEAATARYRFGATTLETGDKLTILATTFEDSEYFEGSGTDVLVKQGGRYRINVIGSLNSTSEDPTPLIGVVARIDDGNGTDDSMATRGYRPSDSAALLTPFSGSDLFELTAGQIVTLTAFVTTPNETVSGSNVRLTIERVSPPSEDS